jgi:hypothetical protein
VFEVVVLTPMKQVRFSEVGIIVIIAHDGSLYLNQMRSVLGPEEMIKEIHHHNTTMRKTFGVIMSGQRKLCPFGIMEIQDIK